MNLQTLYFNLSSLILWLHWELCNRVNSTGRSQEYQFRRKLKWNSHDTRWDNDLLREKNQDKRAIDSNLITAHISSHWIVNCNWMCKIIMIIIIYAIIRNDFFICIQFTRKLYSDLLLLSILAWLLRNTMHNLVSISLRRDSSIRQRFLPTLDTHSYCRISVVYIAQFETRR
jgi:hypothetical protein